MDAAEPAQVRRFELRWLLAGVVWGVFLGVCAGTVPMLVLMLTSGETLELDSTRSVAVLWLVAFAAWGAMYGGVAGAIIGIGVMFAVGRDPEAQAARRPLATVAVIVIPLMVVLATVWS